MADSYKLGEHDARLTALEKRCSIKESEVKALNAFKNRAVGYVSILATIASILINKFLDLLP